MEREGGTLNLRITSATDGGKAQLVEISVRHCLPGGISPAVQDEGHLGGGGAKMSVGAVAGLKREQISVLSDRPTKRALSGVVRVAEGVEGVEGRAVRGERYRWGAVQVMDW